MKLVHPLFGAVGALGCIILALNLQPIVLQVYSITCPIGLIIYFAYGYHHSKLRGDCASHPSAAIEQRTQP